MQLFELKLILPILRTEQRLLLLISGLLGCKPAPRKKEFSVTNYCDRMKYTQWEAMNALVEMEIVRPNDRAFLRRASLKVTVFYYSSMDP